MCGAFFPHASLEGKSPVHAMIAALGVTGTRKAAMDALRSQGNRVLPLLSYHLLDATGDAASFARWSTGQP